MLISGFNCLPLWWQSNMAKEQIRSLLLLAFWLVLLLEASQGLKRNCSAKSHLCPCPPWHMKTDQKSARRRRLPCPHQGKKIATAISYWGIWECSAPNPVPWGRPSVVTWTCSNRSVPEHDCRETCGKTVLAVWTPSSLPWPHSAWCPAGEWWQTVLLG